MEFVHRRCQSFSLIFAAADADRIVCAQITFTVQINEFIEIVYTLCVYELTERLNIQRWASATVTRHMYTFLAALNRNIPYAWTLTIFKPYAFRVYSASCYILCNQQDTYSKPDAMGE